MNKTERAAAPAVGIAIGYFLAMYFTHTLEWLPVDKQPETVAMAGGICTYIVQEIRGFVSWCADFGRRQP